MKISIMLLFLTASVITSCSKNRETSTKTAEPFISSSIEITDSLQTKFAPTHFELIELDVLKNDLLKNKIKSKYFEPDILININLIDSSFYEFISGIIPKFMDDLRLDANAKTEFIEDSSKTWKTYFDLRGEIISISCSEILEVFNNPSCKKILLSAIGGGYDLEQLTINYAITNGRLAYMNVSGPSWTFNYIIEVSHGKISLVQLGGIHFG